MHVNLYWIVSFFVDLFRPRAALLIENAALRQQLAIVASRRTRPAERLLWIALARFFPRWREVLLIVSPRTVIRRHRDGFRAYWRWKSRPRRGRPSLPHETRELVRRMACENPTWEAPRINGKPMTLGIEVSERTVARFIPRRPSDPGR